jgi:MinD-like ATPase involved in chromosome partitioning or flagellar assembly
MYVVTFYSFKGGVGRTFSLVNVGAELAQTGRKVLLVDFDLEAPGITTFDLLKPPKPQMGLVEYVANFSAQRASPDVRDYVYEVPGIGQDSGRLWIMPSGRGDEAFRHQLASINWQALYGAGDGYLMMEDLKGQWQQAFEPDYVLIDSRTGYTDIQGICTRQLPDAVVILFFPNAQNLAGLKAVVSDIRTETQRTREHPIDLVFVMSNVPDLDDEDQILHRQINAFRKELRYDQEDAVIHRYDSLALLNQTIFTRERPNSRLAKEYKQLKERTVLQNVEDRETIIHHLRQMLRRPYRLTAPRHSLRRVTREFGESWDQILERHAKDPEILYLMSQMRRQEGRLPESVNLLSRLIDAGEVSARILLGRAELLLQLNEQKAAADDLRRVLELPSSTGFELGRLVRLVQSLDDGNVQRAILDSLPRSRAFEGLDTQDQEYVATSLLEKRSSLPVAVALFQMVLADASIAVQEHDRYRRQLASAYIGLGQFKDAIRTISPVPLEPDSLSPVMAFHYAMALWGDTGTRDERYFRRALATAEDQKPPAGYPAFYQRQAIALWAVGEASVAMESLSRAMGWDEFLRPEWSYWRYLITPRPEFLNDCQAIARLIAGDSIFPPMFKSRVGPDEGSQSASEAKRTRTENRGG